MRIALSLLLLTGFAGGRPPVNLKQIDELNECVQLRFQNTDPRSLGMSRVVLPASLGEHFRPLFTSTRDFAPETPREVKALAALENDDAQVGLYLFGRTIAIAAPENLSYRALKGPAGITKGTPRPAWYPGTGALARSADPDAMPDWRAIYPLAQRAMRSFADGGKGFETSFGEWQIAARPVMAEDGRCTMCHAPMKSGQAVGGVLYAFRHS
jgi:hypothetical protein